MAALIEAVGADLPTVGSQVTVGVPADHAGLKADAASAVEDFVTVPVRAGHDQHRIGDRLAREACAGGAEGGGDAVAVGGAEDCGDLVLRVGAHDDLGDQAVEARIRAVGERPQRIRE